LFTDGTRNEWRERESLVRKTEGKRAAARPNCGWVDIDSRGGGREWLEAHKELGIA
jgi:hypothetical protein